MLSLMDVAQNIKRLSSEMLANNDGQQVRNTLDEHEWLYEDELIQERLDGEQQLTTADHCERLDDAAADSMAMKVMFRI